MNECTKIWCEILCCSVEYLLQTDQNQSINIFLVKLCLLEIICFVANNHTYSMQCKRTIHLNHYFSKHNTTCIHRYYLWSKSGWCSCFERNLTDDVSILTRQKMVLPLKGHLSVGCSRIQFRLNEEPINAAAIWVVQGLRGQNEVGGRWLNVHDCQP